MRATDIAMAMNDVGQSWVQAMREARFGDAWALSAAVLAGRDPALRDDPAADYHLRWVWDGRPVDGSDVLVRCYHGLGDTIQFARFLPLLAMRAGSVTLEVQPRLAGLFKGMPGIDAIVPFDPARPLPPRGCDLEITELAFALRAPPDTAPTPYLSAPPAALPPGTVGLCYDAGGWDQTRCIPPDLLAPLCQIAPCITLVPEPTVLDVRNPAGCPLDMAATASLLAGSALIVTVDTMIAHLAGAMGKPVWLLLKADPDWRWSPDAAESPWYPSMRLYVQPHAGDWGSVVERVTRDLAAFCQRKRKDRTYGFPRKSHRAAVVGRADRQDHHPGDQERADRPGRGTCPRRP